ncbi:MAG: hypothetical protein AAF810_23875 [Cyanobacteria bacterium P01_D01_bin.36]
MKTTANTANNIIAQLAQRLNIARVFEGTYGAGAMTADYKRSGQKASWTSEQLVKMSEAKSSYN